MLTLRFHEPFAAAPRTMLLRTGLPAPLGELAEPGVFGACAINDEFRADWDTYQPGADDVVDLYVGRPGDPKIALIAVGVLVPPLGIAFASFYGANELMKLLRPTPRKATTPFGGTSSRPQEVYGIAGLTNTIASGTPKFVVFGERRVFGHLIASSVGLEAHGKGMTFSMLYMMGRSNGAGYESISDVELNDIPLADLPGTTVDVRLGTRNQTVIPGFEEPSQVFFDGRALGVDEPLIYTTQDLEISRAKITLQYPGGLRKIDQGSGADLAGKSVIRLERKQPADDDWTLVSETTIEELSLSTLFREISVTFPASAQWQLRVTEIHDKNSTTPPTVTPDAALFNVQEIQVGLFAYPGHALLAVAGVSSAQIQSLESVRISARVRGEKVKVWTGDEFVEQWSQQRAWIARYLLTDAVNGLGVRIPEAMHDDEAALSEQAYWDELVPALGGGTEPRDRCDVIVNERRAGWDWVKDVLADGRAGYVLSQGKFKLIVDRPRTPNLLWCCPGNLVEGSVKARVARSGKSLNSVVGSIQDAAKNWRPSTLRYPPLEELDGPLADESFVFGSITRESQCYRELMYQLKRRMLIVGRHTWVAAQGAQVSEPGDVDELSYQTTDFLAGQSGFVPAAGTLTEVPLDRLVTLEEGATYELRLRKPDNVVERRTVSSPAGRWGRVTLAAALAVAPAPGDLWALGQADTQILPQQIISVQPRPDFTVAMDAEDYVEAVYEIDTYPDPTASTTAPSSDFPPIPLADAQVREQVVNNPDGSQASNLAFEVTPGLPLVAGTAQGGAAGSITLGAHESPLDDHFNGVRIRIVSGQGAGQQRLITDYTGSSRQAVVDAAFSPVPNSTSRYQIERRQFSALRGFVVEEGLTADGPWSVVAEVTGPRGQVAGAGVPRTTYFRFTPVGTGGLQNLLARIVRTVVTEGDTSAPDAPSEVTIVALDLSLAVAVTISTARPAASDLAGWDLELWKDAIDGGGTLVRTLAIPGLPDGESSGTQLAEATVHLLDQTPGDAIWARARSRDRAMNRSDWTESASEAVLT
jgi:hypothetical protein